MTRSWFTEYSYGDEDELAIYETSWWTRAMWDNIHQRDTEWGIVLADHYDKKVHDFSKVDREGGELVCETCELTPEELDIKPTKTDEDIIYS
jgi:hypothetical protein